MNDLIERLAEQSTLIKRNGKGELVVWSCYGPDLERFVGLIIKECCDVLYDNELGGYQVNHVLKEHFGVDK